jgi:hypothetical protein
VIAYQVGEGINTDNATIAIYIRATTVLDILKKYFDILDT